MKKPVSIITLLLLILSLLVGCAPGAAPSTTVPTASTVPTSAPTETTAPTEPTPAETTPTTQPKPVETFPSVAEPTYEAHPYDWVLPRPDIPEKYDIRVAIPGWIITSPLPEDASEYYPIWRSTVHMITWLDARMDDLKKDEDPSVLEWAEYEMKLQSEMIFMSTGGGYRPTDITQADWDAQRLPIPEKYDIRIAYPDWDETQPLPEDASEYYPIWEDEVVRLLWAYECQRVWTKDPNFRTENLSPEDQAVYLWTMSEMKYSAWQICNTYAHAGRRNAGSPYVVPQKHDFRRLYRDWMEFPHMYPEVAEAEELLANKEFAQLCYPYWKDDQTKLAWLHMTYSSIYYSEYLVNNTAFFEDVENLKIIAWLEAETEYWGGTIEVSILEKLGLNRENYLVRK